MSVPGRVFRIRPLSRKERLDGRVPVIIGRVLVFRPFGSLAIGLASLGESPPLLE